MPSEDNKFDKDKALEKFLSENPKWKKIKAWELNKRLEKQRKKEERIIARMNLIADILKLKDEQKMRLEQIGVLKGLSKQSISQLIKHYKI